jgi:SSS family solute:Na+ symporter
VCLIGAGALLSRLVRGSEDFFVAGRRLGPGLLLATFLAANIGAGSTIGAAGIGYRDGLGAWWWVGSAGIGTLILALWVGPRIWKLASEHGFFTVGDFLEYRYGGEVRTFMAVLLWLGTLAILAGQLIALAVLLNVVADLPMWAGAVMGGVVVVGYFTAGGLAGAAWINAIQLVVLLSGFVIAVALSLSAQGGVSGLLDRAGEVSSGYNKLIGGDGLGWRYLPMLVPAFIISPGLLQKAYGAKDARSIRIGVGISAIALLLFAFAPAILGMAARLNHPGLVNPEQALPILLMQDMPFWVGVLGLGALFVADISSADAILFMLATSLSQDLYKKHVNPAASDQRLLRVARMAAVVGGGIGILLAVMLPSVISVMALFYSLLSVSLFVPVIAGLYTKNFGKVEAVAAIVAGVSITASVHLTTSGGGLSGLTPAMLGLISAAVVGAIALVLRQASRKTE